MRRDRRFFPFLEAIASLHFQPSRNLEVGSQLLWNLGIHRPEHRSVNLYTKKRKTDESNHAQDSLYSARFDSSVCCFFVYKFTEPVGGALRSISAAVRTSLLMMESAA
jgi:hypothetical protein